VLERAKTADSFHGRYGAKDMAARYRHRLAEAIASVAYHGLDLSHLMKDREPEGRQQQGQE